MRRHPPGTWIDPTGGGSPGEPDSDGRFTGNKHFEIGPGGTSFIVRWRGADKSPPPRLQSTATGYAVYNPQRNAMEVRLHHPDAEPITIAPGAYWNLPLDITGLMDGSAP
jgi:hypothetical protein